MINLNQGWGAGAPGAA